MRIGLIQVDGKLPNLALMKISAWHKAKGHEVVFPYDYQNIFCGHVDKVYAAVVFTENRQQAEHYASLGAEIESMKPDYTLYGIDYGMGFTDRGCFRTCEFCIVPEKEGFIHHVAMPIELLNPLSDRLKLLNNNSLASPMWEQVAKQIIDLKIKVDFTQGNDIRLMNKRNAELLASMRHEKRLHFAYDNLESTDQVMRGIELLGKAGIKPYRLTFFVLTNFNSTFEDDMLRVQNLINAGVNPYVMIYDKQEAPKQIRHLQRWCNSVPPIRRVCSFEDYKSGGVTHAS